MLGCNIFGNAPPDGEFDNGETIGASARLGNMRIKCIWKALSALCGAGCGDFKRHVIAGDRVT
jgi:hypothetical protein